MSTTLDFQLKLLVHVYQKQLELSFFQNVAKTTKRFFSLLYSICHQVQGNLHLDKSIVSWTESLITTQCVLFCPCVGYLPFWKIKKFDFFSIANPVLSYFQYKFAHCFTSKLRIIKKKDKEIKKIIIWFWGKWFRWDSNSRPLILQASALTTVLRKIQNWACICPIIDNQYL